MDAFKRALENIRRMWGNLGSTQRVVLAASAALMVTLLVWSSTGSAADGMVRVVGREVDEATRAKVLQRFAQGQRYEIRDKEIYVPKADADRVMLELAGDGVLGDDAVWKFLEQDNIFASKWDKEKRLQIAIQRRLEGMIRKVDGVRNASVVISQGSASSQLGFAGTKASASVQVDLQGGLSTANVQAIAGLIARASGVEMDLVHIMDTRGRSYRARKPDSDAAQAQDHRDYELQIEKQILSDIKTNLTGALVVVRVQANNSEVQTKEVTHTNPKAVRTEEKSEVQKGGGSQAPVGIKGEGQAAQAPEGAGGSSNINKESREDLVTDRKDESRRTPAGAIQKITVGVLIPVETGADGKEMAEAEKLLPVYKEWVRAAAGPMADEKSVSVQLVPSKKPEALAAASVTEGLLEWAGAHAAKVTLFVLALLGFLAMLRVMRNAMPKDTVEELSALTAAITQTVESGPAQGPELQLDIPAETDVTRLKAGLRDMVTKNPQNVATSLKAYLGGQAK